MPVQDERVAQCVAEAVRTFAADPANLLQILIRIQDELAWIPPPAVSLLAQKLSLSPARITGVADFYAFLHTRPRGRYDLLISDSITDHMLGKQDLMAYLSERLGVAVGETRDDGLVSLDDTSCTGMCDQGPAGLVNGLALTRLDRARVDAIADLVEQRRPVSDWPREFFRVEDHLRRRDVLLAEDLAPGEALGRVLELGPCATLDAIDASGLRGRGGAGFKTAIKWSCCGDAPCNKRYVVCNADEGEPGTFKDRVLLQSYADLVIEGMTVCARVTGARFGYLYLRGEYRYLRDPLEAVLAARRRDGLLGDAILGHPGFNFDIKIHLGAGAYICGEESALLESLEGKRGVPRKRPPFPVTCGCFESPTVVNNVETFAAAAKVAAFGAPWLAERGTPASAGTKLLSISGDCERPGIYEYPFGVSLRQVLEDCGGAPAQAVQLAGAAGNCVPAREFDRRLAFEDLATSGALMVFGPGRDLLDMLRNFARFFTHESCGFCTPCRVGTALMRDLVEKLRAGRGSRADVDEIRALGAVMRGTSHCGLGTTAPSAVLDVLDKFPEVWEGRLRGTGFEPAFDLDEALAEARALTGRDDPGAHLGPE